MTTFLHSGKLGDIIYALPAVRACGGGDVLIREEGWGKMTAEQVTSILPLVAEQPYIRSARKWAGEAADVTLDHFRARPNLFLCNLATAHLNTVGYAPMEAQTAWLTVDSAPHDRPVFARSVIYHGSDELWRQCMALVESPLFVGMAAEHQAFEAQFGPIEWRPTKDLLELAILIAGAPFFVGNQSCPFAIAEGLKTRCILEVNPHIPNCLFHRPDSVNVMEDGDVAKAIAAISSWQVPKGLGARG